MDQRYQSGSNLLTELIRNKDKENKLEIYHSIAVYEPNNLSSFKLNFLLLRVKDDFLIAGNFFNIFLLLFLKVLILDKVKGFKQIIFFPSIFHPKTRFKNKDTF